MKAYCVAGCKPWNRRLFDESLMKLSGEWHYIGPGDLSFEFLRKVSPRYLFFLHWSWKVPPEIISQFECVCFHMTDVPFGRGGSPLQNLILRGVRETKLTALRMTDEFDAGPVYAKENLALDGVAEEIYLRANQLSAKMIDGIIRNEPEPITQKGDVVNFKRRRPEESELGTASSSPGSLDELYDFIRMLDAEGYPRAFLDSSGFRFEFSRPALYDGRIVADVKITQVDPSKDAK